MKKKIKLGSRVEVQWMDAAGGQKIDKEEIEKVSPKHLLVITETFGILYKEDALAVLILQEDSAESVDYTVIPRGMIVKIRELQ
jgi:uncharacterized protein YndB with AHSA1/START domain